METFRHRKLQFNLSLPLERRTAVPKPMAMSMPVPMSMATPNAVVATATATARPGLRLRPFVRTMPFCLLRSSMLVLRSLAFTFTFAAGLGVGTGPTPVARSEPVATLLALSQSASVPTARAAPATATATATATARPGLGLGLRPFVRTMPFCLLRSSMLVFRSLAFFTFTVAAGLGEGTGPTPVTRSEPVATLLALSQSASVPTARAEPAVLGGLRCLAFLCCRAVAAVVAVLSASAGASPLGIIFREEVKAVQQVVRFRPIYLLHDEAFFIDHVVGAESLVELAGQFLVQSLDVVREEGRRDWHWIGHKLACRNSCGETTGVRNLADYRSWMNDKVREQGWRVRILGCGLDCLFGTVGDEEHSSEYFYLQGQSRYEISARG